MRIRDVVSNSKMQVGYFASFLGGGGTREPPAQPRSEKDLQGKVLETTNEESSPRI